MVNELIKRWHPTTMRKKDFVEEYWYMNVKDEYFLYVTIMSGYDIIFFLRPQ